MSRFAAVNRYLHRIFPSSGKTVAKPQDLSETVYLTHEYPGRFWDRVSSTQLLAGPSVTPVADVINLAQPGNFIFGGETNQDGDWFEIVAGDISHDSATNRFIQLFLMSPSNQLISLARWDTFASAFTAAVLSGFEPIFTQGGSQPSVRTPNRPIIVPPGHRLRVIGDTAGVAYTITLSIAGRLHPLNERALTI